jgi:hypothetical protein
MRDVVGVLGVYRRLLSFSFQNSEGIMSRSGYSDDGDNNACYLYGATVKKAINGTRGQRLLRETLAVLDAMPVKELAANAAFDETGAFCTLGAVEHARGGDVNALAKEMEHAADWYDWGALVKRFDAPQTLLREIMFVNDDSGGWQSHTPEQRWQYVRDWVAKQILPESAT